MNLKTGKALWKEIEKCARKKYRVGEEFKLTMVDLGHSNRFPLGECECRLNGDNEKFYRGFVTFNPYEQDGEVETNDQ